MAANPRRQLPSVDALLGRAEDLTAQHGRSPTRRGAPGGARRGARRRRAARTRASARPRRGAARPAAEPAAGAERDRRDRPHEPRPRAARDGGARAGARGRVAATRTSSTTSAPARAAPGTPTWAASCAELTGAETGMAVNNNAAAVLLCLAALAEGREVVISRGELIEIGDGFRIPDILSQSGARLVEVGTTNRTSLRDYEAAIGPDTAALVRVHQSNFRMVGFTASPRLDELAALAARHGLPLVDDLGSGQLLDLPDLADEPTARSSIDAGATVVCFSGDKLLGGPQAGVIVGAAAAVERVRRHPLARAMRIDKLSLAALEATLELYRDPQRALREVPVLAAAAESAEVVRGRAERLADRLGGTVVASVARVGGGAVPLLELPSFACALDGGDALHAALRASDPPVVARGARGPGAARLPHPHRRPVPADQPLTLGTAGHIDHGKTALVAALTGVDTDRLPQEKARGISIELGYAPLALPVGPAALGRRRAGARAVRAHDGGGRHRHRHVPARRRRRRRRDAADPRARRHHRAAGRPRRRGRAHQARSGRRRAGRAGAARRRGAARGRTLRRRGGRRGLVAHRAPAWTTCGRRSTASPGRRAAVPRPGRCGSRSIAPSRCAASARWSPARCGRGRSGRATGWRSSRAAARCASAACRCTTRPSPRRPPGSGSRSRSSASSARRSGAGTPRPHRGHCRTPTGSTPGCACSARPPTACATATSSRCTTAPPRLRRRSSCARAARCHRAGRPTCSCACAGRSRPPRETA